MPNLRDRRRWWLDSTRHRVRWPAKYDAAISWNPVEVASAFKGGEVTGPLIFDLLDDWTAHPAFATIKPQVEEAYRIAFAAAKVVTANSEGTASLARRLGRADVRLLPNGVDPERFAKPHARKERFTVGYGGKIGFRLDLEVVQAAAALLPEVAFEFAGPVLDREVAGELRKLPNAVLLGDVHYSDYPAVLSTWDVAWAPHALGSREVGGDLIKLYEYRAAGLPVWSTRVIGWERALDGVRVCDAMQLPEAMAGEIRGRSSGDMARELVEIPADSTWKHKAETVLGLVGA